MNDTSKVDGPSFSACIDPQIPHALPRNCLYNGETIWIEGVFDGIKVSVYTEINLASEERCSSPANSTETDSNTAFEGTLQNNTAKISLSSLEKQNCTSYEYITTNKAYYVSSAAQALRFDYLEFTKKPECSEKYCLSNALNTSEEVILKSQLYTVVPPFQVIEKIQGNYIYIQIVPDESLSHEAHSKSVVSINGQRMEYKNGAHTLKLLRICDWTKPLYISVDFEQIQYSRLSSISLPNGFMYSIGLKKIDEKYFAKITLSRISATSYNIIVLNPLINASSEEYVPNVPLSSDYSVDLSVLDLLVGSPTFEIAIESPDALTEILLEVRKRTPSVRMHLLAIRVNNYPIEFCIKM